MYFFILFVVICRWDVALSAACNCGLGPGVSPCGRGGIIGGGIIGSGGVIGGNIIGGGISGGGISGGSSDGSAGPLVVRPQVLPVIDIGTASQPRVVCKTIGGIGNSLKPIGGLCSCGKTVVKPANVPKLACGSCVSRAQSSSSSQIDSSYASQTIIGPSGEPIQIGPSGEPIPNDGSGQGPSNYPGSIGLEAQGPLAIQYPICGLPILPKPAQEVPDAPADAVSIALALKKQQQQSIGAVDSRLAYGFKILPREIPCASKPAAFPEEQLYKVNGQILELKAISEAQSVDEEAIAELEEAELEEEQEAVVPATISLGSLGYGLASAQSGQFISVDSPGIQISGSCDYESPASSGGSSGIGGGFLPTCNDGFRGGEVVIEQGPVDSGVVLPQQRQPICLDGERQFSKNIFSLSQQSAASQSSNNRVSNLLIQRLGGCL